MKPPAWAANAKRTKVVEGPPDAEVWRENFLELRLRHLKVVGDNISLRKALADLRRSARRRGQRSRYNQDHDGYDEDLDRRVDEARRTGVLETYE